MSTHPSRLTQDSEDYQKLKERKTEMFGQMTVSPILQVNANGEVETAVTALLEAAEQPEVVRWIEFANSVVLFLIVSGNPQSGAIYWLDRKERTWYSIDFEDQEYAGYNVNQFEALLQECSFLDLVERPGLLRSGMPWRLDLGKKPEARLTETGFEVN